MKKFVILAVFVMVFSSMKAQHSGKDYTPERFRADMEQYITRKAGLSPDEASRFFPLYSEMLNKQRALRDKIKNLKRIKPKSASECKKNIQKADEIEIEMKKIQKSYHEKFMQILTADKVYDIIKAEDRFHRQAIKNMTSRMRQKRKR